MSCEGRNYSTEKSCYHCDSIQLRSPSIRIETRVKLLNYFVLNILNYLINFLISDPEPQVMDYQAQQNKVLPPLAATFAFHFAAEHLWALYNRANDNIEQGDLELLPDVSFFFR